MGTMNNTFTCEDCDRKFPCEGPGFPRSCDECWADMRATPGGPGADVKTHGDAIASPSDVNIPDSKKVNIPELRQRLHDLWVSGDDGVGSDYRDLPDSVLCLRYLWVANMTEHEMAMARGEIAAPEVQSIEVCDDLFVITASKVSPADAGIAAAGGGTPADQGFAAAASEGA